MPFNRLLNERIQKEKNITVRERHEQTIRRNYNILLALFLGGGSTPPAGDGISGGISGGFPTF